MATRVIPNSPKQHTPRPSSTESTTSNQVNYFSKIHSFFIHSF